jgi:hypothetical protein
MTQNHLSRSDRRTTRLIVLFGLLLTLVAAPLAVPATAQGPDPNADDGSFYINEPNPRPRSTAEAAPLSAAAPESARAIAAVSALPGAHFLHVATTDNIDGTYTYIDHPLLNNNEDALFMVTQDWNPKGLGGTYNDKNIAAWYDTDEDRWVIFNESLANMPEEAAFNVHIPVEDGTVFTHTATASNTFGNYTLIDNPLLNDNPDATVFVTQLWNYPPGSPGVYNDHPIGVWYEGFSGQWSIFNQDLASISDGVPFTVLVASDDETTIVHTATAENSSAQVTWIDDARINGNPNALLTVTQHWNPGGTVGIYNEHAIGVWYDTAMQQWSIFNQDLATMPEGAPFNVLIPPTDEAFFTHTATAGNSVDNVTWLDHPLLNGNPDAILLVTHNWNPGGVGGVYNDQAIGVWYSNSQQKWSIYNQDWSVDMVEGASFNVYVPPLGANVFTHVANTGNSSLNYTWLEHPQTNDQPDAIALFSPNWNPNGIGGTYNNQATGIWYDTFVEKASIFNQDPAVNMPENAAFNVLVPDADAEVFVHTATVTNSMNHVTWLDHPLLNGAPNAIVIVTQNWNPGGGAGGIYNNEVIGVWYDDGRAQWSIFNQSLTDIPEGASFNVLVHLERVFLPLVGLNLD